jgi:hypothetical protein
MNIPVIQIGVVMKKKRYCEMEVPS